MDNASPFKAEAIGAANARARFLAGSSLIAGQARAEPARSATLRPVRSTDGAAMERFVMRLSAASRRMRFHGAINACGPELLRRLTQADGMRHVAYVACIDNDDEGEQIVGEARYFVSGIESAEFAIAVADSHHGRGTADALLRALLRAAGAAGLARLYGDVLDGNARMAGFLQRHGFAIDWHADADADADPGTVRWQRKPHQVARATRPMAVGARRAGFAGPEVLVRG